MRTGQALSMYALWVTVGVVILLNIETNTHKKVLENHKEHWERHDSLVNMIPHINNKVTVLQTVTKTMYKKQNQKDCDD